MPSHSDTILSAGIVRDALDLARLPWIRPLVRAHARDFASVAPLFAGDPAAAPAWRATIDRVLTQHHSREVIGGVIAAQQRRRGAVPAAVEAARRLASSGSVAIVTGQQAGLFGGPLYTLFKAVTAIQLAARVEAEQGVAVVPLFWVDAEDHDWDEVRTAHVLDRDFALADVGLDSLPGGGSLPIGTLRLDAAIEQTLTALEGLLAPTEFTPGLMATLRQRYRAGETMSGAFAGLMEDLLGPHGLVVFDSSDPAAKPVSRDIFTQEIDHPSRTSRLAGQGALVMSHLGHTPQIEPPADGVCLFYLSGDGRTPIRSRDGGYLVGERLVSAPDLREEAVEHPERFSPNVLLRPLVQDRLFPTVAYVGGPSELGYHAQLGPAYEAFDIPRPLLCSRVSATILDSAALRFLERHSLPLEALQAQDESALNRLLEGQLPASLERAFREMADQIALQTERLKEGVAAVDPTLVGAVDTTADRMRDALKNLQGKIVQASKKKDETLKRQFMRTRALAFPGGHPQERVLNLAFFINRYGPSLPAQLIEGLPPLPREHYVVTP